MIFAIPAFFKSLPGLIMSGLIVTIILMGASFYIYAKWNNDTIDTLRQNAIKYEQAVDTQKKVIEQQGKDFTLLKETVDKLQKHDLVLAERYADLVERQKKQNVGAVALKQPEQARNIINVNSKESNRCFEILMGSPRTPEELAAVTKDKINSMCPDIANPKYKASK